MSTEIFAGAAEVDISPQTSQFLFGYPHVNRWSTGIHDPLLCSTLFIDDGSTRVLFAACDLIYFDKGQVREIRAAISSRLAIPENHIMLSATHTHSGPVTVRPLGYTESSVVPPPDPDYLALLKERICQAAESAASAAVSAEFGLVEADSTGIGTNRRDPAGPRNPIVPVLAVRGRNGKVPLALLLACSMHPTVLHEDSLLVSADFPGMTRQYLKKRGYDCPILYTSSPAGNQSPRHVTKENTFSEAERIGSILGKSVAASLEGIQYRNDIHLQVTGTEVELPLNPIPDPERATRLVEAAAARLENLRRDPTASRQSVRTAECDWFGAERRELLARVRREGGLEKEIALRQPAEVQLIAAGPWRFVAWPGEVFVEYALQVMAASQRTYVLAYTNGETYGYLVTEEAVKEGGYEAATALFKSPESPELLVSASLALLAALDRTDDREDLPGLES